MTQAQRAAVYLRYSPRPGDPEDARVVIAAHRKKCRALIEARGWTLGQEFVDESVSASKARGEGTGWHRMLQAAERSEFDVVVAVDMDRLLRTVKDLSTLIDTGAKVVTVDGEIDLSTADGEFRGTMLAAIARFEGRRKAERRMRTNQHRREQGLPSRVALPILGYRGRDGREIVKGEAAAVARAYDDFLAGVSLRQLARDLNAAGWRTSKGREWTATTARRMLMNPRYSGRVLYHATGELFDGDFEAIVPVDTWDAAQTKLNDPSRRSSVGQEPTTLLSSLAVCEKCQETGRRWRVTVGRNYGRAIYRCRNGCFSRAAEKVDRYVNDVFIATLSRDDARDLVKPTAEVPEVDREALRAERRAEVAKKESLARLLVDGVLDELGVRRESARIQQRINEIDSLLEIKDETSVIEDLVDAEDVEKAWWDLDLTRRRLVVSTLADVTFKQVGVGQRHVPVDQSVGIAWR